MPATVHSFLTGRRVRILHASGRCEESVVLETTPSGQHLRLACDPPLPNGIARWRRRDSVELLAQCPPARSPRIRNVVPFLRIASGVGITQVCASSPRAVAAIPPLADNIIPFPHIARVRSLVAHDRQLLF